MKTICIITCLITLTLTVFTIQDLVKLKRDTEGISCFDMNWQNPVEVICLKEQPTFNSNIKATLQSLINRDFIFMVSLFTFCFSLCIVSRDYYSLKKRTGEFGIFYKVLLWVGLLQILGLLFDYIETSFIDNLIQSAQALATPWYFWIVSKLKYIFGGLGLGYIH